MNKTKVFVIMPFTDDFFESYEMIKNHFENDFEFTNAGDEDNQQNILADIITPIYNADIVLADLTGLNPNVMYELGIAHSFNKKTIVITRDDMATLPFDLKQYRAKGYSTHFKQFYDLLSYLDKNLHGAVDGSVIYNNPVNDFLDKNQLDPHKLFVKEQIDLEIPDNEKGFIDFMADIEEDINAISKNIGEMTTETLEMSSGIEGCTQEMKRVQKTGGNGTASFMRKQSKKAAEFISTYSKHLKEHNESINSLWTKAEKNIFGLLENQYTIREDNKDPLISFLKSLYGMQKAISSSNESLLSMKEASLNNLGFERSMNQSIRFLDDDLATYLSITEQMYASIDRILSKSKFIVGDIDFSEEKEGNNA